MGSSTDETSEGPPPLKPCDVFEQDCPPGQKCTLHLDSPPFEIEFVCVDVVREPNGLGEPCQLSGNPATGEDDCDAGLACSYFDPVTLQGFCFALCVEEGDGMLSCPDRCIVCPTGELDYPLCDYACDPLAIDCPEGHVCVPSGDHGFQCLNDLSDGAGFGDPCSFVTCPLGSMCIDGAAIPACAAAGEPGCCAPYCDVDAVVDPCPELLPGTTCTSWLQPKTRPPPGCERPLPGLCVAPG